MNNLSIPGHQQVLDARDRTGFLFDKPELINRIDALSRE